MGTHKTPRLRLNLLTFHVQIPKDEYWKDGEDKVRSNGVTWHIQYNGEREGRCHISPDVNSPTLAKSSQHLYSGVAFHTYIGIHWINTAMLQKVAIKAVVLITNR
ncbi:hypothetical protein IMZ48_21880 [Candidatus Bathyarchaeota archaeon]|nr:hypothetical protein [Candidatus Bathyarchaeota archaeon]